MQRAIFHAKGNNPTAFALFHEKIDHKIFNKEF